MTNRLLRIPTLVGAVLAAMTLAACSSTEEEPIRHGEFESVNVETGNLLYQVQMSRELNPAATDDRQYLEGVVDSELGDDEEWFGVWVRVENATDDPQEAAEDFHVVDAEGNEYEPVEIDDTNPFKYEPVEISGKASNDVPVLPQPETASGSGPNQGALLLFKLRYETYQNSPVELEIEPPDGSEGARVLLDM